VTGSFTLPDPCVSRAALFLAFKAHASRAFSFVGLQISLPVHLNLPVGILAHALPERLIGKSLLANRCNDC